MTPLVLIVEEQSALRRRYARFLRDEGYEVVTAAKIEETIPLAKRRSPNVVVLDPESGGGKGMEAAHKLLKAGLPASLVFNTSHPISMETDFSTWVADAYTVRTHGVEELGRTLRKLLVTAPVMPATEN
ncbi:MAG: response regulator [Candidatus Eisenbacteria sp.]|nr:response regulator [Candidatus Eisenbacteria bacterium]